MDCTTLLHVQLTILLYTEQDASFESTWPHPPSLPDVVNTQINKYWLFEYILA